MKIVETKLQGAFIIEREPHSDDRGHFARSYCQREFANAGIFFDVVQSNIAFTKNRGTMRGLHYQHSPHAEAKLVSCVRGEIFDLIVDMRADSPTFKQWNGELLSPENGTMVLAPEGFAHGYLTLQDDSEVMYQVNAFYEPSAEGGVRWNDSVIGIKLPGPVLHLSRKDASWPELKE